MAIDTQNKRRSAIACGLVHAVMFPVADGTIDTNDLPHAAGLYRGFIAVEPPVVQRSRMLLLGVRQFALFIGGIGR